MRPDLDDGIPLSVGRRSLSKELGLEADLINTLLAAHVYLGSGTRINEGRRLVVMVSVPRNSGPECERLRQFLQSAGLFATSARGINGRFAVEYM